MIYLILGIIGVFFGVVILIGLCNFAVNTHRRNKIANFTGITKESAPIQEDLKKFSTTFKLKFDKFTKNLKQNFGQNTSKPFSDIKSNFGKILKVIKNTKKPNQIIQNFKDEFTQKPQTESPKDEITILELPFEPILPDVIINPVTIAPETATIDMLSLSEKPLEELSAFEKKETRIYQKIQDNGIEDYVTWMELGALYETQPEYKIRAKEVYAFVLKQTKGEIKERAKNKLVSL